MQFSAQQLAELLQGTVEGKPEATVHSLSKIEEGTAGSLSFLANPKYTQYIYSTKASIIIVNQDFEATAPVEATLIRVSSAEIAFSKLLALYNQIKNDKKGISAKADIAEDATLGSEVYVGAFVSIGSGATIGDGVKIYPNVTLGDGVKIGANTTIHAGVQIYSDCIVGQNCIIHSGTVIGSDGFRFAPDNNHQKIPQIGNVVIEDDVEIGANCAIDRATLGSTILRKGVKFDNHVHIAHNVEVGSHSYLAAGNVIAGSTKIGKGCMFSGQVGIVGHVQIADNTIITAQSGISKTINKAGEVYMGSPAFEAGKYRKAYVHFRNLDGLAQRIAGLEERAKKAD